MTSIRQYRCPNCKHKIPIASADFIKGIAFVSCADCGRDAFAIEEALLKGDDEDLPAPRIRGKVKVECYERKK